MKNKKLLSMSLVAMLIIGTAMLGVGVISAEPGLPYVSLDPASTYYEGDEPNEHLNAMFTLKIIANNVSDCYGSDFQLTYNDTLLEYQTGSTTVFGTNAIVNTDNGNPLPLAALTISDVSIAGRVKFSLLFKESYDMDPITPGIQSPKSFNGTGVVAWITFKIIYVPTQPVDPPGPAYVQVGCNLDFDDTWTFIYKKPASVIPKDPSVGGTYTYKMLARQAGVPTADFTYSPGIPFVCDDVALTSTSTTPTGSTIVSYKWTVTGNATLTGSSTTAQTTMHCDGPGIATVTLNVTNSDGLWDEETKYIVQKEVIGCMLDLYTSDNRFCGQTTDYVGKGLNEACDALSPDVNVTLFVEITWNNAPVMHVLVAFEVIWEYYVQWDDPVMQLPENWVAKNECVLYRTAETDKDGIARIWFRVPTPCPGQMFGKWRAYATAKIQEVKQEDEMPFDVGYLITLVSLETEAPEYIREVDAISFRIKGKSISWMDKVVTFVVVAYDDCDVPIGQYIYETTISRGMYCSPNHFEIIIGAGIPVPQWAYVGIGKLYVSAFTAIPKDCGVAYCPEKGTLFEILYVPPP